MTLNLILSNPSIFKFKFLFGARASPRAGPGLLGSLGEYYSGYTDDETVGSTVAGTFGR
jgi:hypothetical protein